MAQRCFCLPSFASSPSGSCGAGKEWRETIPTHLQLLSGRERVFVRALSVPLPGRVRGGFQVSTHAKKRKGTLDDPPPLPALSPALGGGEGGRRPGEGDSDRFMVPLHCIDVVGLSMNRRVLLASCRKHCRQDAGSILAVRSHLLDDRRPFDTRRKNSQLLVAEK